MKNSKSVNFDANRITQTLFKRLPEHSYQPVIKYFWSKSENNGGCMVVRGGVGGAHTQKCMFYFDSENENEWNKMGYWNGMY